MSCTVDSSPCNGFADGSGSFWHWVGMNSGDDSGQLCGCCCEMGCEACAETHVGESRAYLDGKRWLRPSRERDGRDAYGRLHDLSTNEPHRVPVVITYDKAPCYDQNGGECYAGLPGHDSGLCRCDDLSGCGTNDPRCEGVESGGRCGGLHPDRFTYRGHGWSGGPEHIKCRETNPPASGDGWLDHVRLAGSPLFQAAFVRSDNRYYHCTSNRMALCGGVSYGSDCVEPPPFGGEYYIGEDHQAFGFCTIEYDDVRLSTPADVAPSTQVARRIKNLALERLMGLPGLSQLDYRPFIGGPSTGNNHLVDRWGRTWGFGLPPEDWRAQGHVVTYENCRLRQSGCPVRVSIFVRWASVEMSLVAHKTINRTPPPDNTLTEERLWPSARVRIYAELGVHAELVGPCVRTRHGATVALEVVDDPAYINVPAVAPVGADSIVYIDDEGTEFIPPLVADWWGYHGEFGATPWAPVEYQENINTSVECCQLGYHLDGLRVAGWPTAAQSQPGDAAHLYRGSIRLGFRTSQWCTQCAESGGHPNPPECDDGGGAHYIPPVGVQPRGIVLRPIGGPVPPGSSPEPIPPFGPVGGPVARPITAEPLPPATPVPHPPGVVPIGATPYPDPPIARPVAPPPPKPPRPRPIPPSRPGRRMPVGEFPGPPRFVI